MIAFLRNKLHKYLNVMTVEKKKKMVKVIVHVEARWVDYNKKKCASAGNRTRAARVAGEHSTTEPPMRSEWYE